MVRAAVSLRYATAPSALRFYPRAVFARRAALLPAGSTIPRIEGEIGKVSVRPRHLARYREVCAFADDGSLPISYPHVLAMPLHVAMLTHPAFVVRLMGLVHVANEIEWHGPLPADGRFAIRSWVEGHRDTDRGQEFELHTQLLAAGAAVWAERSTLLARQRAGGRQAVRAARKSLRVPKPSADSTVAETRFAAERWIGRRYGLVSGDLNPIHGSNFSARRLGFDRAVAHGMWSMARSLACLGPELTLEPCRVSVEFKLPLFLPSEVRLEHWDDGGARTFVLRQGDGNRPHLAGTAVPT